MYRMMSARWLTSVTETWSKRSARRRMETFDAVAPAFASVDVLEDRTLLDGALDPTFDGDGKTTLDLGGSFDTIDRLALQSDGKIIAVGSGPSNRFAIGRFNPDGSVDSSFGTAGTRNFEWSAGSPAVHILGNGKILIGLPDFISPRKFRVMRLNPDGTTDNAFGVNGTGSIVTGGSQVNVEDLKVQPDGKIILAGYDIVGSNWDWVLTRFNADGSVDNTFGTNGLVLTDFDRPAITNPIDFLQSLLVLPDGKILAGGLTSTTSQMSTGNRIYAMARYNSDGSLDSTFDGDGKSEFTFTAGSTTMESIGGMIQLSSGKILATSIGGSATALIRFNADATLDTGFGSGGQIVAPSTSVSWAHSAELVEDSVGRILVVGGGFASSRFLADGSLDTTFGTNGTATVTFSQPREGAGAIALQPDGKILVGGFSGVANQNYNWSLARLEASAGAPAGFTFTETGGSTEVDESGTTDTFDVVLTAAPQSNVVVNVTSGDLTEVTVDQASLTFTPLNWDVPQTVTVTGVDDTAVDGDPVTLVTLSIDDANSDDAFDLLSDQFVSITTTDDDGLEVTISASPISENGGMATGTVVRPAGLAGDIVVQLSSSDLTEASVPASVTILDGANLATFPITAVDDSFVDGLQTSVITATANLQTGSVGMDTSFGTGGFVTLPGVYNISPTWMDVEVQPDGKIVTALFHPTDNNQWRIVRYNSNGTLDSSFGTGGIVDTNFGTSIRPFAIELLSDGKILVEGEDRLVRYLPNGAIDTTFGTNGIVDLQNFIVDIAADSNGRIYTIGTSGLSMLVKRYASNGALDTTFGSSGETTIDFAPGADNRGRTIVIQDDGKILAGGMTQLNNGTPSEDWDFALARLNTTGALDSTFGSVGKVTVDFGAFEAAQDVKIQPDGKILLGGGSGDFADDRWAIARLNSNGSLDTTFSGDGKTTVELIGIGAEAFDMALQDNGSIVLAGGDWVVPWPNYAFARLLPSGNLDPSFDGDGIWVLPERHLDHSDQVYGVDLQPDGKLVAVGGGASTGGSTWDLFRIDLADVSLIASAPIEIADDEVPGFTIVESASVTEVDEFGDTDSFTVVLDAEPQSTVTLDIVVGDPSEVSSNRTMVRFPTSSWNTPQIVTLTGLDDALVDGDVASVITISVNQGLSDDGYDLVADQTVSVTTFDNEINDFGDAPAPYPTTVNGAVHGIAAGFHLGASVDGELNGQPTALADGDDLIGAGDDEDGVTFTALIVPGQSASVNVVASLAGLLDAWIDFNADGDWADPGEQVFSSQPLVPGSNALSFAVPTSATSGTSFSRFRFSSTGGLSFDGAALDGEVEDYIVTVESFPPTITNLGASKIYKENAAPVLLVPNAAVTDADTQIFSGGQLRATITNPRNSDALLVSSFRDASTSGNDVLVAGTNVGTVSSSGSLLFVDFNVNATRHAVQSVLNAIAFETPLDNPFGGSRDVEFVLSDGEGGVSSPVTQQVSVTPIPDRPELMILGLDPTFVEDSGPMSLIPGAGIGDDFESGTLGSDWTTSSTGAGRIQVSSTQGAASGSFALLMDSSVNGVNSLNEAIWNIDLTGLAAPMLSFSFAEWGDESHALPSTFTGSVNGDGVSMSDDGATWHTILNATASSTGVWVDGTYDLATLATNAGLTLGPNFRIKFQQYDNFSINTDGRGWDDIRITSEGVSVWDPDQHNQWGGAKLNVQVSRNADSFDRLTIANQGTGPGQVSTNGPTVLYQGLPIGDWNGGVGTTRLQVNFQLFQGTPLESVQAVIQAIEYENLNDQPAVASKDIRFELTDPQNQTNVVIPNALVTVNLQATNDLPTLTGISNPVYTYNEGAAPQTVGTGGVITDSDYNGGGFIRVMPVGGEASDRLTLFHQGTGTNQVGVSGNQVSFGGVLMGTISGGVGMNPLQINLNSNATRAGAQAILRLVQFSSISQNPSTTQRQLGFLFDDGDGAQSNVVTAFVNVSRTNDPSVIANYGGDLNTAANTNVRVANLVNITDLDSSNFDGGLFRATISSGQQTGDTFSLFNDATISVVGSDVFYSGTLIGTLSTNATSLTVLLNSNATAAVVQRLGRNLEFRAVSSGTRAIRYQVLDGDGGNTTGADKNVVVS